MNVFRTTFNPNIPQGVDVPVRLSITPSDKSSNFRVQIYLNGWQLGKYINNIGPQTEFVFPAGYAEVLLCMRLSAKNLTQDPASSVDKHLGINLMVP